MMGAAGSSGDLALKVVLTIELLYKSRLEKWAISENEISALRPTGIADMCEHADARAKLRRTAWAFGGRVNVAPNRV